MQKAIILPATVVPITCADTADAYRYFRSSLDSPSGASTGASPAPSGSDDFIGGDLGANWEVNVENESTAAFGMSRRSVSSQSVSIDPRHYLGAEAPDSLSLLLESLISSALSGNVLHAGSIDSFPTRIVTALRVCVSELERHTQTAKIGPVNRESDMHSRITALTIVPVRLPLLSRSLGTFKIRCGASLHSLKRNFSLRNQFRLLISSQSSLL